MLTADQEYLRDRQYRDASKLEARSRLHRKHGRNDWHSWLAENGHWPDGAACLDSGCGAGAFWVAAASLLPASLSLCLLDLSPGMVETAVEAVRATGRWASVRGETADATALPFEDGAFDTALAIHMLYHLPDPAKGAAELRRVLKPGGLAMIALNGRGNMQALGDLRRQVLPDAAPRPTPLDVIDAEPLLRACFEDVELVFYPDTLVCTDPRDVIDYMLSMPPMDSAPEARQADLIDVVRREFDRRGGVLKIGKEVGLFLCRA
jgi:SAM-dependent methyltransferase